MEITAKLFSNESLMVNLSRFPTDIIVQQNYHVYKGIQPSVGLSN